MGTGGAAGQTFQIHHHQFTTAVEAIKKMVNDGDASYEKISLPDSQGTVDVTDSFTIESSDGEPIAPSTEKVPGRKGFYIRWFSVFGTTFVFRETKADQPVGLVTYFQLFGWVPETWRPELSKQERCKEFINAKYSEPQANATHQAMLLVGEESLKMFLPGYSGWDKVWNKPQKLLGVFETLVGLATLGFYGKVNSMRKAIAWTTIGLASAQLSAALIYQPTVGEVAGAVLPPVLVIPYTLPVKWVRQVTAGGLIWYQMVVHQDLIDSRILAGFQRRIANIGEIASAAPVNYDDLQILILKASHLPSVNLTDTAEDKILKVTWQIALRNHAKGQPLAISLDEARLVKERIEAVDGFFRSQRFATEGLSKFITYEQAMSHYHINRFTKFWAAWNRWLRVNANNRDLNVHIWFSELITKMLPNGRHLDAKARENLLVRCIKTPDAIENEIKALNLNFSTFGPGAPNSQRETILEWANNLGLDMGTVTSTFSREMLIGFLIANKPTNLYLYRLVPIEKIVENGKTIVKVKQWVNGTQQGVDVIQGGVWATGVNARAITTFTGAHKTQDFIILRIPKGGAATPCTGEQKIFEAVIREHGSNAVPNEVVYLAPNGKLADQPACVVPHVSQPGWDIPVYDFIPVP